MIQEKAGYTSRRAKGARGGLAAIGIAVLLCAWLQMLLIRSVSVVGGVLIVVLLGAAVMAYFAGAGRAARVVQVAAIVGVLAEIVWLVSDWYPLLVAGQVAAMVVAFACLVAVRAAGRGEAVTDGRRLGRTALRGAGVLLAGAATVVSVALLVNAVTPVPLAAALQSSTGYRNSFEPAKPMAETVVSNTRLISDVRYGDTYPNSYLDIYIADNDPTVTRPTFVIVHGGGFIVGDKTGGDPNAVESTFALGNEPVLDAGYNLVSIDYGLAPQVPYPTPVIQLTQAIEFLKAHGGEYGLDMSTVVLSGGSAGGHIIGQYAIVQTNPAYARQMNIAPSLSREQLKALVFDSAVFDPRRSGQTEAPDLALDWIFALCGRTYVGTTDARLDQANIIDHTTSEFPPAFIADGNTGTFPDQARELADRLDELGVRDELVLYPLSEATLRHGFMGAPSRWTDDYNQRKVEFLRSVVG
jgi:acetyl esterase/lipase